MQEAERQAFAVVPEGADARLLWAGTMWLDTCVEGVQYLDAVYRTQLEPAHPH